MTKRRLTISRRLPGILWPGSAVLAVLLAISCGSPSRASAQSIFKIDQRFGSIDFSVDDLGLFTTHGGFSRFMGTLAIDQAQPTRTSIDVAIDATSVDMDSADALNIVRSTDFFDVVQHPRIDFHSTGVTVVGPGHYRIAGDIKIRDVTQPLVLDAMLVAREKGTAGPIADFVVQGTLNREAFGMVADRNFISDTVQVKIHARIVLDTPAPAINGPNAG